MTQLRRHRTIRRASVLLSLLFLFCSAPFHRPALASAAAVSSKDCACCESAAVACAPVCEAPRQAPTETAGAAPDDESAALLGSGRVESRSENARALLGAAQAQRAGPPLFLTLRRLLD
jgi:hypothetical protein